MTKAKPIVPEVNPHGISQVDATLWHDKIVLLDNHGFLGSSIHGITFKLDRNCPTMAVGYRPDIDSWIFMLNPDFYMGLDDQECRQIALLHEGLHIVLFHPMRFLALGIGDDPELMKLANYAADAVVNEELDKQFKGAMRKKMGWAMFYETLGLVPLPDDTFEKVFARLLQQQKQGQSKQPKEGEKSLDEHNWDKCETGEGDGESEGCGTGRRPLTAAEAEKAANQLREVIASARNDNARDFGNMSGNIQAIINSQLSPKIRWADELRIFGQSSVKRKKQFSKKRFSRRLGEPNPGKRKMLGAHVLMCVDVSGSTEAFREQFHAECKGALKHCTIDLITFDTQIIEIQKNWKASQGYPSTGGGTDCQCIFDYAQGLKRKPDAIIILTDGEFSPVETHGMKVKFVLPPNGQKRPEGENLIMENT